MLRVCPQSRSFVEVRDEPTLSIHAHSHVHSYSCTHKGMYGQIHMNTWTCTYTNTHQGKECWFVTTMCSGRLWLDSAQLMVNLRTSACTIETLGDSAVGTDCTPSWPTWLAGIKNTGVIYFVLLGPAIASTDKGWLSPCLSGPIVHIPG